MRAMEWNWTRNRFAQDNSDPGRGNFPRIFILDGRTRREGHTDRTHKNTNGHRATGWALDSAKDNVGITANLRTNDQQAHNQNS